MTNREEGTHLTHGHHTGEAVGKVEQLMFLPVICAQFTSPGVNSLYLTEYQAVVIAGRIPVKFSPFNMNSLH